MKRILIAATAIATLAGGAAVAQPYVADRPYGVERNDWVPINQRQEQLARRIDRGVERGQITRAEARRLTREFNQIARLESRYRYNGLSFRERADLDRRFDRLAAQIRWERRDGQNYGYNRW